MAYEFSILGRGRAGRALAAAWGDSVALLPGDADPAGFVLLAVPDDAIPAQAGRFHGRCAHLSGSLHLEGVPCAHPLTSFDGEPADWRGTPLALTGNVPEFLVMAFQKLGFEPFHLEPRHKALYHASAVLASAHSATLWLGAAALLRDAGVELPGRGLMPLVEATRRNIERLGAAGRTGPFVRGDQATIERDVAALPDDWREIFLKLGRKKTPGTCGAHGSHGSAEDLPGTAPFSLGPRPLGRQGILLFLSKERFASYLCATGDEQLAWSLYRWNMALSEALYTPIQILEVGLRNRMHAVLCDAFGDQWFQLGFQGGPPLKESQRLAINAVLARLARSGKDVLSGTIIPDLGFGFWSGLFDARFDQVLWHRHIKKVFPMAPRSDQTRKTFSGPLEQIRRLRNRVFHHEPIWSAQTETVHQSITQFLGYMDTDLLAWDAGVDRFPEIWSNRPVGISEGF